mgnify:FL=1
MAILARSCRDFLPGDRVKILKTDRDAVWGTVSVFPFPCPQSRAGNILVVLPDGFWGFWPPERLRKVSGEEWGMD